MKNNILLPYLLTKDTTHAYVSDILRKGGERTEKWGEMGWGRGNRFFFFSSKVAQIRHGLMKTSLMEEFLSI